MNGIIEPDEMDMSNVQPLWLLLLHRNESNHFREARINVNFIQIKHK